MSGIVDYIDVWLHVCGVPGGSFLTGLCSEAVRTMAELLPGFVTNNTVPAIAQMAGSGVVLPVDPASAATESQNLWPFLLYAVAVVTLLGVTLLGSWLIGSRTRRNKTTDQPFESGVVAVGTAEDTRLSIEFYLIAMFFVIFDLETIFIFGWAVAFFELGWQGYFGAAVFIVILLVALVYEWRTGALDWGLLRRRERGGYSVLDPGANRAAGSSLNRTMDGNT